MDSGSPTPVEVIIHPAIHERSAPHLIRLVSALREVGVVDRSLRATSLLRRGPVVLHVNWPEHIVRSNGPLPKRIVKQIEAAVITVLLMLRHDSVIWTAHNLEPHGGWNGPLEAALFRALRRRMTAVVTLVPGHDEAIRRRYPDLADLPFVSIEPGSLAVPSGRIIERPAPELPVRMIMVGAIAPYKQQLEVLGWLRPFIEAGQATLSLVGPVGDGDYLDRIRAEAPATGFEVVDRWVSDAELDDLIRAHHVAVAPQDHAFNTGVPYVVLPAGVPVVLSPSRQAEWLIESQGAEWVRVVPDGRDATSVADLIAWAMQPRTGVAPGPWDWGPMAEAHRRIYSGG